MFQEPENSPWSEDGLENGEQCWRLNTSPTVQFQLFAKTDDDQRIHPDYHSPRLFWEKDVREPEQQYACDSITLTDEEAVTLLSLNDVQLAEKLAILIADLDG